MIPRPSIYSVTGEGAVLYTLLGYWYEASNLESRLEAMAASIPHESITALYDENLGKAIDKDKTLCDEFLSFLSQNPFGQYVMRDRDFRLSFSPTFISNRIWKDIGMALKKTQWYRDNLHGIKKSMRQMKSVRKIMES